MAQKESSHHICTFGAESVAKQSRSASTRSTLQALKGNTFGKLKGWRGPMWWSQDNKHIVFIVFIRLQVFPQSGTTSCEEISRWQIRSTLLTAQATHVTCPTPALSNKHTVSRCVKPYEKLENRAEQLSTPWPWAPLATEHRETRNGSFARIETLS